MKIIAILLAIILLSFPVYADLGPKPQMTFNLIYQTSSSVELLGGQQIQCEDKDCVESHPLEPLGPQHFECGSNQCQSMAYGYSSYQKLILNFSDKVRESNIFAATPSYNEKYNVLVTDSGLVVENPNTFTSSGLPVSFIESLIITLILEVFVGYVFVYSIKNYKRILASIVAANIISLTLLWLAVISSFSFLVVIVAEVSVTVFEALFVFALNKKMITLKNAFVMSVVMNLASFIIGGIVLTALNLLSILF